MARGRHLQPLPHPRRTTIGVVGIVFGMMLAMSLQGAATEHQDPGATPSTNDANRTNGWAHFNVVDTRVGAVEVEFVSTRAFISCFEYRSDGEPPNALANYNEEIHDGLWPFTCVTNSTAVLTIEAEEYVEIRMVFGAEGDERFDWTRVEVLPLTKDACRDGGWDELGYRNPGMCTAGAVANPRAALGDPPAAERGKGSDRRP